MTTAHRSIRLVILATLVVGVSSLPASAWQKRMIRAGGNAIQVIDGEAPVVEGQPGTPGQPAATPGSAKPADGSKPDDPNKAKEGEKKKEGPAPLTTRPAKPQKPANPDELKNLKPDSDGRVKFNLKGQPWPDVLDWLAETSQKSLDWQELPNDYLNLVTQQSYSIDEARDLLNRHLLSRGFTMLTHGETISVVNVAKINPGMVPRVEPDELATLPDHDYVKTSFPLAWLLADQAENELKPMASPNGKLTHLTNTNRLEAMDSVKNLREIWSVIQEEQSGGKQEQLVREFKLKHTKANEVLDQLHILLGINKPNPKAKRSGGGGGGGGGMDPNMMMQFQQQMQQMMQQMQQGAQQAQGAGGAAKAKPGEVRLLANERENSILATAPPDKMAIVSQAVKTLDVVSSRENLLQNIQRMQVYRLSGLDPASLVELLDDVGNLDPTTKLQIDAKNKSIVAHASLADHLTIKMLVDKLDGTGRKFQVIPLRKLGADYVAGTIEFMMAGGEKDKNQNRRQPYYMDFYDQFSMGGGRSSQTDSNDKFRVDADVENNRLLLWANEIELREIENLLMKLGEIPPPGGNRNTQRYLDNLDPEDVEQMLERIRRIWPSISPNELLIDEADSARSPNQAKPKDPPETSAPREEPATKKPAKKTKTSKTATPKKVTPAVRAATPAKAREVLLVVADDENQDSNSSVADDSEDQPVAPSKRFDNRKPAGPIESRPRAPIRIRRGPDGQLVLESQDTDALDRLEDLMHEAAPPKRDYKVFYLKYPSTWAYSVELSLKEFFEVEKKKSGSDFNPYFGMRMDSGEKNATRRLSKPKTLKIISDSDSGTILVQGATSDQLKTIDDLIKIYDRPPSTDGKQVRKTQIFTLKYSKANVIGETIKDVYRDLLSTNDKAYQNQPQKKDGEKAPAPDRSYTFIYGDVGGDDKSKQETPVKFKGLVSLGVDDISNTIIVSAPDSLLQNIAELIEQLDRAARPTNSVQVVKLDGKVNSVDLQKRLAKIFTKPQPKPPQQRPQQPHQPQQQLEMPQDEP